LFLSAELKTTQKQKLKSLEQGKSTQAIYTGSLLSQELHPVPRNPWISTKQLITDYNHTTKEVTLNTSSHTLSLAHNPQKIRTPSDSALTHKSKNTKDLRNDYT